MSSICDKNRVIIIKNFEVRFASGITLRDDWSEAILNTLALNGLFLGQHFNWSTPSVAGLRHLKLRFVWQIVGLFVLWDNFLNRVTKLSCL